MTLYPVFLLGAACLFWPGIRPGALFAGAVRGWLLSERGGRAVNRLGGAAFMFFGAALAAARK